MPDLLDSGICVLSTMSVRGSQGHLKWSSIIALWRSVIMRHSGVRLPGHQQSSAVSKKFRSDATVALFMCVLASESWGGQSVFCSEGSGRTTAQHLCFKENPFRILKKGRRVIFFLLDQLIEIWVCEFIWQSAEAFVQYPALLCLLLYQGTLIIS